MKDKKKGMHWKRRMAYTFRRAFRQIGATASTTAFAFIANLLSKIMPIKAFGIFAAVVIIINYILVLTILPPVTIFYY